MTADPAPPPAVKAITAALADPFDPREVRFKPQSVKGTRAMALAYIDARVIQDRLDEVLGVENWQDEYTLLPDGSVVCKLTLNLGGRWIAKMDVGSPSEQPDGGDRLKAAFSDALKRAAVKFGIGRYIYRLPAQWCDYDPNKRQLVNPPQLPAWALPKPKPAGGQAPQPQQPAGKPARAPQQLPADGAELHRRLREYDAKLAAEKLCGVGAVLAHVAQAGKAAGFGDDIAAWSGPAIPFAVEAVKRFEGQLRRPRGEGAAGDPADLRALVDDVLADLAELVDDEREIAARLKGYGVAERAQVGDLAPAALKKLLTEFTAWKRALKERAAA